MPWSYVLERINSMVNFLEVQRGRHWVLVCMNGAGRLGALEGRQAKLREAELGSRSRAASHPADWCCRCWGLQAPTFGFTSLSSLEDNLVENPLSNTVSTASQS